MTGSMITVANLTKVYDTGPKAVTAVLINIRIEHDLYKLIKKEAIDNDMSIKNLLLYSVLAKMKKRNTISDLYMIDQHNINALIFQVRKIGVNINQIAKKINSGEIKEFNFDKVIDKFEDIEKSFEDFKNNVRKVK